MFYTVQETAKLLKVSQATIRRLIKMGKLQAFYVGRQLRITEEALKSLLLEYKPREQVKNGKGKG